jgi:hypothetical protein
MAARVLRPAALSLVALAAATFAARAATAQAPSASADVVRPAVAEAAGQRVAAFAGIWELNSDESAFGTVLAAPQPRTMEVRERDGSLHVRAMRMVPGANAMRTDERYALDGRTELIRASSRPGETSRVDFAGDTLVLTRTLTRNGRPMVVTDRWYVSGQGARLAVCRHVAMDGDEAEQFIVYDRRW